MKILQECKRLLSYGGLGTEQYVNIGGKRVPRAMIRAIPISMLILGAISQSIIVVNSIDLGLLPVLIPTHSFLHYMIKCVVYCILLWKTNEIARLIDYIEMVIQRRRFFDNFFSFFFVR